MEQVLNTDSRDKPYLAARLDGYYVVFPVTDIFSLEPMPELETKELDDKWACGRVHLYQTSIPVYALNTSVSLESQPDAGNRVILLFQQQTSYFALACREIKLIGRESVPDKWLPRCMQIEEPLFNHVGVVDSLAAYFISKQGVWQYLLQLGAARELNTGQLESHPH